MTTFQELAISAPIKQAVLEIGYQEATAIQQQAIPLIIAGHDVLGKSQTGTGKTAAFGIPALEHVQAGQKNPQVLILCPTRELVIQVAMELRRFCKYKEGVKIIPIYGGEPIQHQIRLLARGCGIVVGTPGRLMDHLRRHTLKLHHCDMVVLDEADEMLNMGFKEDIEEILHAFPHAHQTILFSATMPEAIMAIAGQFQKDPITVEIASAQKTIHTVEQLYYEVPRGQKGTALKILLRHYAPRLSIIFCNTKKQVDELSVELSAEGMNVLSLHGDMKQEHRTNVMKQYRSGTYPILIATDVAARGIDVDDVELVCNYDIPQDNEYYIHRIGRTGRAGKSGKAITLVSGKRQERALRDIMHFTKTNIRKCALPSSAQLLKQEKEAFIERLKTACGEEITAESIEIANRLMAEGIAIENLISALIAMNFKPQIIETAALNQKRRLHDYETLTLQFDIGRKDRIQAGNLVCAIAEYGESGTDMIGRIDVRSSDTLVAVAADSAKMLLERMQNAKIGGKSVTVRLLAKSKKQTKEHIKKKASSKGQKKAVSPDRKRRRQTMRGKKKTMRKQRTR